MKILYIVTKSDWGGAQKYVFNLALSLKNEYDVSVAAGEGTGELFDALSKQQIPFHRLCHLKRLPNPFKAILAIKEMQTLIENEKPDILHLNSTTAGFLGSISGKVARPKPKIVYTAHGWAFLEPGLLKKIVFFMFEAKSAWLKNKFIVLSQKERRIAQKWLGIKKNKIAVIPNGAQTLQFFSKEEARQKLNLPQQDNIIGAIANPYKTKGLQYLLRAFLDAVVIGDGPEKEKLQKQFPNAKFLGKILEAHKYLKAFDVFCLPSVKEGFPWVILEAMQAQVPIVATKVGALPEIISNEQEGFLVAPKNPQALKEKISFLLQNPEQAKKMAQKAREKSALFTLERMAKATKKIYRELRN